VRTAGLVAAALAVPAVAAADRGWHVGGGAGGYAALAGVDDFGPAAELEWYPGGAWGRFGVRAAYLGFGDEVESALLSAGVTYTAAHKRPKLHIAFHGDAAATAEDPQGTRAGLGGGIQTQLWLWGPLAIGLDATLYALFGGDDDATFHVGSATTLRLSF
jgi:hypothetical protein